MESLIVPEVLESVSKQSLSNVEKYDDIRTKLKEKSDNVTKELIDADRFTDQQNVVDNKLKALEPMLENIRNTKKDPESITESLEEVREFIVIIEEVFEIIVVIEQILIVVKKRCEDHPKSTKELNEKDKEVADAKKKTEQLLAAVKAEENKLQQLQQQNKEVEKHIQDLNNWLPSVEGEIVKRTPVSANYNILKKQQEENQVYL